MKNFFLTISLWVVWITLASFSGFAQDAPPKEENKREANLVELNELDKTIKLDIRYARADNFVGRAVYTEARAFLQYPAAEALIRVHKKLKKQNLDLIIFDSYRPWSVTKIFWDVTPDDKRKFVANPKTGSRHNRGCAVDLSLFNLKTGKFVEMPTDFDDFTDKASPRYAGGTTEQTKNRDLLRQAMEAEGFTVNDNEWWHFDYKDWKEYAIYDVAFSEIRNLDLLKDLRIRRVEFAGNTFTRDRDIRKKVLLKEGEYFTAANLQKTIKNINELALFEKITEQDVSWFINKKYKEVDFVFYIKQKPKK